MPPTSSPMCRAIRSTCSMISGGASARSTRKPVFGASSAHADRDSARPSVVWQTSAGTQVEQRVRRREHVDGVEEVAAQYFHARDVPVAERRHLLHERDAVDAEVDRAAAHRVGEGVGRLVALDSRAAAADVRLDEHRVPQTAISRRGQHGGGAVGHARRGIRHAQRLEELELQRFGRIHLVGRGPVDDGNAEPLQMAQPLQRVERRLTVAAQIRRRTRPVEHQRVRHRTLGRVVGVRGGIEAHVGDAAPIELGEERPEPVRMLVKDRNGFHGSTRWVEISWWAWPRDRPRPPARRAWPPGPARRLSDLRRRRSPCGPGPDSGWPPRAHRAG